MINQKLNKEVYSEINTQGVKEKQNGNLSKQGKVCREETILINTPGIQTYYQQYREYKSTTINPITFSDWLLGLVRNMRGGTE